MSSLSAYIELREANKIIKGINTKTGVPIDHVQQIWNSVDKEVVAKHVHGNVDSYKEIGDIVKTKIGVPLNTDEPNKSVDENE